MSKPAMVEFDLDRYLRNSKKVDLSELDWDDIPNHELSDGDVMCLHYMMDIETHTVIYLRDLLATRAAADPQITAFLSCWVYEELWHGEAFSDFLRRYGIEEPIEPRLPDGRVPLPTRGNRWRDLRVKVGVGNGFGIVPTMLGSAVAADFVAIHMMWGAVNELTTLTGYYALIRRSRHPVLHKLLHTIIQDERRHFAFYRAQAKARMERSARTRKMVRWVLRHLWSPVGAGVKSEEEVDALALYLFADSPEGREQARGIDETIAVVPGLKGLTLIEDYLAAAERRAADRPGWAGIEAAQRRQAPGQAPVPGHWTESEEKGHCRDVMPATSDVERHEEKQVAARIATAEKPSGD
jgi:rubrerythrin